VTKVASVGWEEEVVSLASPLMKGAEIHRRKGAEAWLAWVCLPRERKGRARLQKETRERTGRARLQKETREKTVRARLQKEKMAWVRLLIRGN
jgi:hypothetical protein